MYSIQFEIRTMLIKYNSILNVASYFYKKYELWLQQIYAS